MWRMQETKTNAATSPPSAPTTTTTTMSPLGPVIGPSQEDAMLDGSAAAVRSARPHVLLQVRPADPFSRYEHLQRHHHPAQDAAAMVTARTEATEPEEQDKLQLATAAKQRHDSEDDESDEEELKRDERPRSRMEDEAEDEQEDDDEDGDKRNGDIDVEGDVEVDVCREGDESNPSSPVDLTASSRCPSDAFVHPLANRAALHPFTCLANGVVVPQPSLAANNNHLHPLVPTVYHLPVPAGVVQPNLSVTTVCSGGRSSSGSAGNMTTTTTTTTTASSVQGNKRGLAFSVENILDPNKFTGGRVVQSRLAGQRRRRRSGSVHEGCTFSGVFVAFGGFVG